MQLERLICIFVIPTCTYIHAHMHMDVHAVGEAHLHLRDAHLYVCMHVCTYVRMYVCMYGCMDACMYVRMYGWMCMQVEGFIIAMPTSSFFFTPSAAGCLTAPGKSTNVTDE